MLKQRNILMLVILAMGSVAPAARAAEADDNPQAIYHEDKADMLTRDAAPAPDKATGLMPYQGDSLEDTYADDPVKLYSTPGVGLAYKPGSTPDTELKLDLHGAAVNEEPDARDDNLLHTPGDIEAGASFHF